MRARKPIKKIFVRFFTMSRLFADGYSVTEGDGIPRNFGIPDIEVKSRELSNMDFFIPKFAIGFVFYEIITSQVEDNGQIVKLTSGEVNLSGRHFLQHGQDFGRIATRDEAPKEYDQHTYMRRYCHAPLPERIILYTGEHYFKHGYSVSRTGRHHTRESSHHVCTFDFLETDVAVPIWYNFAQGHIIKAFAKKKGWVKQRAA